MSRKKIEPWGDEDYIRQIVRALAVLAVALAVSVFGGKEKIRNLLKNSLDKNYGTGGSKSAVQTDDIGLTVEFIDVGQGDCTLISSGGEYMLIDTGDRDGSDLVIEHLEELGIERLDYLVLSHPHADHIGEAAEIVEDFEIGDIIVPDVPDDVEPESAVLDSFKEAAAERGEKLNPAPGKSFELGECIVQIYAPEMIGAGADNLNNYSLIVRLEHGENSFLFPGDCEIEEEIQLLAKELDLSADVLKAAHHGSYTSSSREWLEAVSPEYAVICCGAENQYGHPHEQTLKRLEDICDKVYITAESGSITFVSDGKTLSVETELGDYDTAS